MVGDHALRDGTHVRGRYSAKGYLGLHVSLHAGGALGICGSCECTPHCDSERGQGAGMYRAPTGEPSSTSTAQVEPLSRAICEAFTMRRLIRSSTSSWMTSPCVQRTASSI